MRLLTTTAFLSAMALWFSPLVNAIPGDRCSDSSNGNANDDLEQCQGGTVDSWFNYQAKIEKVSENCNADDSFIMGALVSEVVRQIECSIPEYKGEVFLSEMCELPEEYHETQQRLLLEENDNQEFHRQLGTWTFTYNGGGRCRKCRRNKLRKLTSATTRPKRSLRELKEATVDAVCSFATSAKLGADIAARSLDDANINYEQVIDLAAAFYDSKKGAKMVQDAEKEMLQCDKHRELALDEFLVTEAWCNEAKKATSIKRLEKCLKGAEETAKKAMEEAKKAAESNSKVREVKRMWRTKRSKRRNKSRVSLNL